MVNAFARYLRKEVKTLFCVIGLFTLSGEIAAQKLTDTIHIQEVKVYGKRKIEEAGSMVTHIDTLAIQMMKTQTISELLSSYSPVFMKSFFIIWQFYGNCEWLLNDYIIMK